jgi:large subunit ribosomal protein L27Ae
MRFFHKTKQIKNKQYINIEKIVSLTKKKNLLKGEMFNDNPVINLANLGFFTVLGKGKKPNFPLIVKAKKFSKNAEKKILNSGGKCILIP